MKHRSILLIEDNEGDILLTKEALDNQQFVREIDVVKNGSAAIEHLESILHHQKKKLPDIIFLDINLPKMNGQEVLQHIKSHEGLKHVPVVVLTTSSSERDIQVSYQHHANCYITKPVDVTEFMETIAKVEEFWFSIATIPSHKK